MQIVVVLKLIEHNFSLIISLEKELTRPKEILTHIIIF